MGPVTGKLTQARGPAALTPARPLIGHLIPTLAAHWSETGGTCSNTTAGHILGIIQTVSC